MYKNLVDKKSPQINFQGLFVKCCCTSGAYFIPKFQLAQAALTAF
jgi:hypothetical protein